MQAFESITGQFDKRDVVRHMVALCSSMRDFKPKIDYFPREKLCRIVPELAHAATSKVGTSSEDEFKGDEIKMKLDRVDSDLVLPAMVERPPAGYRIRSTSCDSRC